MSQVVKPQPVSNRPVVAADEGSMALDSLQGFYEKNKKTIGIVATTIVVLTVGIIAYTFYTSSQNNKAAAKAFYAQEYFMADSLEKALQGDGQHYGFLKVIKEFGGTKTGNLSHYYAGICHLKLGDPKKAINQLEDFDGKGTMVATAAYARLGDAYMETGNVNKAIDSYKKATEDEEDIVQTPLALMHLGAAYEQAKQPEEAIKVYKRIRDDYPTSMPARDIERDLARLGIVD